MCPYPSIHFLSLSSVKPCSLLSALIAGARQMHTHTSYSLTAVIPSVFLALGAIALGTNEIE